MVKHSVTRGRSLTTRGRGDLIRSKGTPGHLSGINKGGVTRRGLVVVSIRSGLQLKHGRHVATIPNTLNDIRSQLSQKKLPTRNVTATRELER